MQHLAGGLYYRACLERSNAWDWHGVRSGGSALQGSLARNASAQTAGRKAGCAAACSNGRGVTLLHCLPAESGRLDRVSAGRLQPAAPRRGASAV